MPRNKVLEKAKVSLPSGRNAVDLSQEKSFAQLGADLNVCYVQAMVAGSSGSISRKCFTRTADVVSPAFHRVTEHFDFFIVPIHSLWRAWENWKLNMNDMQDTNLVKWNDGQMRPDLSLPGYAPRMNFHHLANSCRLKDVPSADNARKINDMLRLTEQLRFGCMEDILSTADGTTMLNILLLGAYQKCYFEHYRNTAYESNNPYAYNFDWLYANNADNGELRVGLGSSGSPTKYDFVAQELFKMRRVNYRNDYFHNIYPSLNYVSSAPSGVDFSVPSDVSGQGNGVTTAYIRSQASSYSPFVQQTIPVSGSHADSLRISVQTIRSLFALDKLMRASAYAPKHVRDQYKALYGVDGVEDFDMRSERIGSFQSDVNFVEVTNMAQSASANLGDLGAKGVGGKDNEKPLKYYCKYDSIIIGLHYFLPRARYDALGVYPWNVKIAREDFYIKAFENLGLRPFYMSYIDMEGDRSLQVGWTVPNFDYKILPDVNEGPFKMYVREIRVNDDEDAFIISRNLGQLRSFVPHVDAVFDDDTIGTSEYFKAAPEDLNTLFVASVPVHHPISHFQFYGDFRIMNAAVIPQSIHGQPTI